MSLIQSYSHVAVLVLLSSHNTACKAMVLSAPSLRQLGDSEDTELPLRLPQRALNGTDGAMVELALPHHLNTQ